MSIRQLINELDKLFMLPIFTSSKSVADHLVRGPCSCSCVGEYTACVMRELHEKSFFVVVTGRTDKRWDWTFLHNGNRTNRD